MAKTLFDKIWDGHVIADLDDGFDLLHIDRLLRARHVGAAGVHGRHRDGSRPRPQPRLIYGTPEHTCRSRPGRTAKTFPPEPSRSIQPMRETDVPVRHRAVRSRPGRTRASSM